MTNVAHDTSSARWRGLNRLSEVLQFHPGMVTVAFDAIEKTAENQPEDTANQTLGETGPPRALSRLASGWCGSTDHATPSAIVNLTPYKR